MKKKLALLLAALLVASAAFGCAKKDPATDTDSKTDIVTPSEDEKGDTNPDETEKKDENTDASGKTDETPGETDDKTDDKTDDAVKPDDKTDDASKPVEKPVEKPDEKPVNPEQPTVPEVPSPGTNLPGDTTASGDAKTDLSAKSAADIIAMIYEKKPVDLYLETVTLDLTDLDSVKYNTGLTSVDGIKEIAVSEPMMSSQAYSLVVVRVNDSSQAASVAKSIKDGVNPRKWVCVEADDMKAATSGDLVLFFMVQSDFDDTVTTSEIVDAFKQVCGTIDSEL